jgi:hypothetical protein
MFRYVQVLVCSCLGMLMFTYAHVIYVRFGMLIFRYAHVIYVRFGMLIFRYDFSFWLMSFRSIAPCSHFQLGSLEFYIFAKLRELLNLGSGG